MSGHRPAAAGAVGERRALAAVVGAGCLFGTTGTIATLAPASLSPLTAGAWRSVIGAVVLLAVAHARAPGVTTALLRRPWSWIGGVGVAGYQLAFFESVERTGVALGTTITIGSGPVFAGLLDAFLRGRPPTRGTLAGMTIAIVGVALLGVGTERADPIGIALAVCAGAAFPLYGEAAQHLMGDAPFLPATASVFVTGAALLTPLALTTAPQVGSSVTGIGAVVALGVVTLAAAYVLWGAGLTALSLSTVVSITLVEPAVATLLAVVVIDEPLTRRLVAGIALIAVGVAATAGASAQDSATT